MIKKFMVYPDGDAKEITRLVLKLISCMGFEVTTPDDLSNPMRIYIKDGSFTSKDLENIANKIEEEGSSEHNVTLIKGTLDNNLEVIENCDVTDIFGVISQFFRLIDVNDD